jgi:hypothetical protein
MATVHENLIVVVLVDTDYGTSRLDGQRAQLGNKFKTDAPEIRRHSGVLQDQSLCPPVPGTLYSYRVLNPRCLTRITTTHLELKRRCLNECNYSMVLPLLDVIIRSYWSREEITNLCLLQGFWTFATLNCRGEDSSKNANKPDSFKHTDLASPPALWNHRKVDNYIVPPLLRSSSIFYR